jgi:hypothetical protein
VLALAALAVSPVMPAASATADTSVKSRLSRLESRRFMDALRWIVQRIPQMRVAAPGVGCPARNVTTRLFSVKKPAKYVFKVNVRCIRTRDCQALAACSDRVIRRFGFHGRLRSRSGSHPIAQTGLLSRASQSGRIKGIGAGRRAARSCQFSGIPDAARSTSIRPPSNATVAEARSRNVATGTAGSVSNARWMVRASRSARWCS